MSKVSLAPDRAGAMYETNFCRGENLPFGFTYGGKRYAGLPAGTERTEKRTAAGREGKFTCRLDDCMTVTVNTLYNEEFGEMEYTVWFENTGERPTEVLSDVETFRFDFPGGEPVLRSCLGDHENYYAAYEHDLAKSDRYFKSEEGRATHVVFPYFDLCCGDGGAMVALGWAGTWEALFAHHDGVTTLTARTCIRLNACLLPGEKVRTGLVVILPYRGRSADDAANLWREWFLKYNAPKADAQGTPLAPFTTSCFACDTGLPNSDGSISERFDTWQKTLRKSVEEGLRYDFRWFDAGWYSDPAKNTVETDWWGTIGSWEIDPVKWPGDSFRESNEACHKAGMKVFVWFEPERVTHVADLAKNYGYKPEWGIEHGTVITSNIGDEECLAWTLERITSFMEKHGVDLYREDNNSDPGFAWAELDQRDEAKYGLPRAGVNENKCIVGHYRLWDGILDYCAKHGKCTFLDSCASGGGRNDIESMRRSVPMMRSDYDRTTIAMRLSQSSTFPKWIPFHGSCVKETADQLGNEEGKGPDSYISRASFLPIFNYHAQVTQNPELDFDLMRANLREWRDVSRLLMKDFYVLTPWRHHFDRFSWTAFAYDDPEAGESLLLGFRQEDAKADTLTVRLPFVRVDAVYDLTDADSGETRTVSGGDLAQGFEMRLEKPRSSRMFRMKRREI